MSDRKPESAQTHLHAVPDWRAFFDEHWRFVLGVARRLGGPRAEADDVAQEVLIVAHRRFAEFNHSSTVRTWLYGICFNVIREQRRSAWRRERLHGALRFFGLASSHDPARQAEVSEELRQVHSVLDQMKPAEREVFMLRELEELSAEEISTILGIPAGTVRRRHFEARRSFLLLLAQKNGGAR